MLLEGFRDDDDGGAYIFRDTMDEIHYHDCVGRFIGLKGKIDDDDYRYLESQFNYLVESVRKFKKENQFNPDYAIHPGEYLKEILESQKIKKVQLADWCQLSTKTISQIINGKANITPEIAVKFELMLGVAAYIWNNLQKNYDYRFKDLENEV
jgi:addiction module HigA family antidote